MTTPGFIITTLTDQSPEKAYQAINNPRGWWSEAIEGSTDTVNSVFTYHYKDVHYCKIKVAELVPHQKTVWQVLDNYFDFTKDKNEWKGTTIFFDISSKGGQTEIRFTHQGLVPQYECYDICKNAWSNYITNSLRNLVNTGKGQPNPREEKNFVPKAGN